MQNMQYLASERTRSHLELAAELRQARKLQDLNRATRQEQRAERRLVEAWRRSAQVKRALEVQ
jgi:hypothetical protein